MKVSTSSLMLASIAFTGSTLAVPAPRPFESPVPGSPVPDEWPESVRSPSVPRSPMPAMRVAGRRRSLPRFKREDGGVAAAGLLSGLGDALHGIVGQAGNVVGGLPIVGGLGIRSAQDDSESLSQNRAAAQRPDAPSASDLDALRGVIAQLATQPSQVAQTTSQVETSPPVDPAVLRSRLQALQALLAASAPAQSPVPKDIDLQGIVQGVPVAGPLASNLLDGLSLGSLPDLAALLGRLPVVGGLVENGPLQPVGGVLTTVQDTAGGLLNSVSGTANNLIGTLPLARRGGADPPNSFDGGQIYPAQVQLPGWVGMNGHDDLPEPHRPTGLNSALFVNGMGGSLVPAPPPPSPASGAMSALVEHVDYSSSPQILPLPVVASHSTGEVHPDQAVTSVPAATPSTHPTVTGRITDVHGIAEEDMHEGGVDAVPGPQDAIRGTLTAPRFMKKIRRRLRGFSVAF
ncbi:hypothetical protein FRC17_000860 [Serendipita sp. 399]|nr:hypothetical protein FRC17_000860 [Serendipita sp. 399]